MDKNDTIKKLRIKLKYDVYNTNQIPSLSYNIFIFNGYTYFCLNKFKKKNF